MPAGDLDDQVMTLELIDHHVHGAFVAELTRAEFEVHLNEGSPEPVPPWMTQFDSQLGFAIRRWCAPLLDLPRHAPAEDYWARRTELGVTEVTGRFLRAATVSAWLLDAGFAIEDGLDGPGMTTLSGGTAYEIVRLESIAEGLAGTPGRDYADEFGARLATAAEQAVGVKTIMAYRCGFDIDLSRPAAGEVAEAADRWTGTRLTDPVLIRHGLHAAVDLGLPIQFHTGYGDRDLDLARANPLQLLDFLRLPEVAPVPVMLLHCYPYHREAGYLAQAFTNVYFDVGLGLNHSGVRAEAIVAESFEVAPFAKQLYSSDAWGPPELHFLGSMLWRTAISRTFGRWVADGDWSADDALRVAGMVGGDNARRVYQLER